MLSESEYDSLNTFIRRYCEDEVAELCQKWPSEKRSMHIDYSDLFRANIYEGEDIATVLTHEPMEVIKDLRHGAESYDYPVDMDIEPEIRIQGSEYERTVEQLRKSEVGKYITVRGQVNQLTQVVPKPVTGAFDCLRCGNTVQVMQRWSTMETPDFCEVCEDTTNWTLNDQKTTYEDHQIIELSALPEDTGGQVADTIKVEVTNDITGVVSAGDRVKISGILKTEKEDIIFQKNADSRRPIYLDGWAIQSEQESFSEIQPTELDRIQELSSRDDIYQLLIDSFAPHIHTDKEGDMQKLSLMLSLFGGVQKQLPTGSQIRGNINVLLIGDAGTAKSQYLKTAEKIAPKSVLASGKGATAAGLTATAEQSNLTGEWTLKAGALVLANNGIACIDEFDKMKESARKSIHEALENQEIPVTKAGINATLPARTAVIAAANPIDGEFNRFDPLSEQVDMEPPLISRFDLIFGLKDEQEKERDETIARTQHNVGAGESDPEPAISYDLLREYIAYARQIEPTYESEAVKDRLVDYYVEKREESSGEDGSPIGPRLNDSLRRLAQASARVRLSDTITAEDAEMAIEHMSYTIGQIGLNEDGELSGDQFDGGRKNKFDQLKPEIIDVIGDNKLMADEIARELSEDESDVREYLDKLKKTGDVIERKGKYEVP